MAIRLSLIYYPLQVVVIALIPLLFFYNQIFIFSAIISLILTWLILLILSRFKIITFIGPRGERLESTLGLATSMSFKSLDSIDGVIGYKLISFFIIPVREGDGKINVMRELLKKR